MSGGCGAKPPGACLICSRWEAVLPDACEQKPCAGGRRGRRPFPADRAGRRLVSRLGDPWAKRPGVCLMWFQSFRTVVRIERTPLKKSQIEPLKFESTGKRKQNKPATSASSSARFRFCEPA